jgi:hypothetical protein
LYLLTFTTRLGRAYLSISGLKTRPFPCHTFA